MRAPLCSTGATSLINIGIVIDANPTPIPTTALPINKISFVPAKPNKKLPAVKNILAKIATGRLPNLSFNGPPKTENRAAVPTVIEMISSSHLGSRLKSLRMRIMAPETTPVS